MRKINVAYNNAFRMIMRLPRYCSASNMFAMCNVPSCQAVMRNLVYRFTIRVDRSENKLLCAIGVTLCAFPCMNTIAIRFFAIFFYSGPLYCA